MNKTIGVVGLWHLGCVLSAAWAKLGNQVIGFDYDGDRVDALNNGRPPIFEPKLEDTIKEGLDSKHLRFTKIMRDLNRCDFVFLSYDTPVLEDDGSDTSILSRAVNDLRDVMKNGAVLIVSSQTPVGLCSELRDSLRERNDTLELTYSPENLRLGDAISCYLNPERIILGSVNPNAAEGCVDLFAQIPADVIQMSLESAELVKHGINAFLATSIVFVNSLAEICEKKSASIEDVARGMKSDPRIGQKAYLSPGIGFSGGTLGRDLRVLQNVASSTSGEVGLFGVIHQLNQKRKFVIVQKVADLIGNLNERRIAVLGLTYKPDTSTLRRSLPLEIVDLMLEEGAQVRVFDPQADYGELPSQPKFSICESVQEAAKDSELLILLTEWKEFRAYPWASLSGVMRTPKFFDVKNFLDPKLMQTAGFEYYSVGAR